MGGDHGPHVTVPAVTNYLDRNSDVDIVLVGLPDVIESELRARGTALGPRLRLRPASEVVGMDESPALALRGKKDSSMRVAINLVKSGEAQACVSAGNTGALIATSRFVLKMLPGIDRPALAVVLPTMQGHTYVLDLGANVDCTAEHLLQFGVMGATLVSSVENKTRPSVGLLNIGEEEIKGNEVVKQAAELLRDSGLNFFGNIEGDDIYKGTTDVVVCDGFVGNVILKSCESVANAIMKWLKHELMRSKVRMAGAFLAQDAFRAIKKKTNYEEYGGMPLLGVNGICIIAHGASTALAIKNALRVAGESIEQQVNPHIVEEVRRYNETQAPLETAVH